MENSAEEIPTEKEPLLKDSPKGGLKTLPFILVNGMLLLMGFYGLMPSMGLFLTGKFHVELTTASNIINLWVAVFNVSPMIGAAIADSYLGRHKMMGLGSVLTLLGTFLLWLTTVVPGLSPGSCNGSTNSDNCSSSNPSTPQLILLSISLGICAIGSGFVRSSILAFGVDQIKISDDKGGMLMQKFFRWYYATTMASLLLGFTILVYIQENIGWKIGFGISVILVLLATLCFFAGSCYYVKSPVIPNLFIDLIQVAVASYKKRNIKNRVSEIYYHGGNRRNLDSNVMLFPIPTEKFRFLNKACIIEDEEQELNQEDGTAKDPWSLCRVEQVEDLKTVLKGIPIFLCGVIAFISMSQGSFQVIQANSTNRKIILPNFEIPAGSFATFSLLCLALWIPLYDEGILPLLSIIKGKQSYFTIKQRIGAGIVVSFITMIVTAIVESIRRKQGNHGIKMSSLWLLPQYCLLGIMEALIAIGQSDFFIGEFPKGMWSFAASLCCVEMALANVVASFLMNAIDGLSKIGGNVSWVSTDINKGHLDYYFWVVSGLCFLNFLYYIFCCRRYGVCKDELHKTYEEENGFLA